MCILQVRLRKELQQKQRELKKAQRRERVLKKKAALLDNGALIDVLVTRAQTLAAESEANTTAPAEAKEDEEGME